MGYGEWRINADCGKELCAAQSSDINKTYSHIKRPAFFAAWFLEDNAQIGLYLGHTRKRFQLQVAPK